MAGERVLTLSFLCYSKCRALIAENDTRSERQREVWYNTLTHTHTEKSEGVRREQGFTSSSPSYKK